MPIKPELLEILACPLCKEPVALTSDGNGLKCASAGGVSKGRYTRYVD
jgi:uncharacterized protein YbaR (Trm112 family)